MTNRRKIIAGLVLAAAALTACGDGDDGGGNIVTAEDSYQRYRVHEVTYQQDVYRCIHGTVAGAMWCENVTSRGGR